MTGARNFRKSLLRRTCRKCGESEVVNTGEKLWVHGHACPYCGDVPPAVNGFINFAPELADTISGFDPDLFAGLAAIEDDHFWFVPRSQLLAGLIEHIEEDEDVLNSAFRALVPGGGLILSVPQHPWLWSDADDVAHHVRRYRRGELQVKLKQADYQIIFSGSYCATLLPLMMISRWKERLRRAKDHAPGISKTEFNPARSLNAGLKWILDKEVSATLAGVRFPVGGSRIVVAVRPKID